MTTLPHIHFTHDQLLRPTNLVPVVLIGAGGNGSQMLTALARIDHALLALGHPGLQVTVFDADHITSANLGRQLFAPCEVGMNKAEALIARTNRFFGTSWKSVSRYFDQSSGSTSRHRAAIYISCVDSAAARFAIADIIGHLEAQQYYHSCKPCYWLDLGNAEQTGQAILATIGEHRQPASDRFRTIAHLPFVTDEYGEILRSQDDTDLPSCSLAEALERQDLFINPSIVQPAASLLWRLFRQGYVQQRGFFFDLERFQCMPIPLATEH